MAYLVMFILMHEHGSISSINISDLVCMNSKYIECFYCLLRGNDMVGTKR